MTFLQKLLGGAASESKPAGALGEALSAKLASFAEVEQQYIVCLAGLLSSVAHRDFEVCTSEKEAIESLLATHTELQGDLVGKVTELTLSHGQDLAGVEDYKYLRLLNELLSLDERKGVIRILFGVAIANDDVSAEEEHHIGLLARDLKVERRDFIAIRNEFKEFIAVLDS